MLEQMMEAREKLSFVKNILYNLFNNWIMQLETQTVNLFYDILVKFSTKTVAPPARSKVNSFFCFFFTVDNVTIVS